ncbi:MAG: transposase, partial [Anaeroplasma sp.]|nr:transposase [Anaeroplasma sp.]
EINLFERMKDNDKNEILYFMKDFNIPFTNNNVESSQRGVKVKQKIGKFRTEKGANSYFKAKSFILTLKKRKYSIFESIKKIILLRFIR